MSSFSRSRKLDRRTCPREFKLWSLSERESTVATHLFTSSTVFRCLAVQSGIVAHCRFPLYIPQKIGTLDTWDVTFGPVTRALHGGPPPVSIDMIPEVPKTFATGKNGIE